MSRYAVYRALERHGPMTVAELTEHLNLDFSTVWRQVRRLKYDYYIHIVGWITPTIRHEEGGKKKVGRLAPIYAAGHGGTVHRPKAQTDVQRSRKYREENWARLSIQRDLEGAKQRGAKALGMWAPLLRPVTPSEEPDPTP